MTRDAILTAIHDERIAQHEQWDRRHAWGWGDRSSPDVTDIVKAAVLTEETGEVVRAVLEDDDDGLRRELVQVAAVAVAWLEAL